VPEAEQQTGQSSSQGGSQAAAGGTSQQGSSSGTTQTQTQQGSGAQQTGQTGQIQQTQAPSRPEYVPESLWDPATGKAKDENALNAYHKERDVKFNEYATRIAAEDSKKLTLPPTPDGYKVENSPNFKLPDGIEFKLASPDDPVKGPIVQAARAFAHKAQLTQSQFSELLDMAAAAETAGISASRAQAAKEREALGATGGQRVDAIMRWMNAYFGEAAARPFIQTMAMKSQIEGWEKVMQNLASQGAGSFRATGREGDPGGRLPAGKEGEAMWEKMSYGERKAYAEKFPQTNGAAG
jgi:hypothetical protein